MLRSGLQGVTALFFHLQSRASAAAGGLSNVALADRKQKADRSTWARSRVRTTLLLRRKNGAVSEDCATPHENPNLIPTDSTVATGFRSIGDPKRLGAKPRAPPTATVPRLPPEPERNPTDQAGFGFRPLDFAAAGFDLAAGSPTSAPPRPFAPNPPDLDDNCS